MTRFRLTVLPLARVSWKKALYSLFLVALGIALGRSWTSPSALAVGDPALAALPPAASANGDTNGDGARDIADAVYLLRWLFQGGPEPVAVWGECPPRFQDNGDGTVSDSLTGLLWKKGVCDVDADGAADPDDMVLRDGADAVAEGLDLGGLDGWRLPNQFELFSLIDVGRWDVHIYSPPFEPVDGLTWVLSTNGGDPCHGCPMGIDFLWPLGLQIIDRPEARGYVRAVRGEQWPAY